MKLLFDQNLSFRLTAHLEDFFPDSLHVKDIGLEKATDSEIWEYAKKQDMIIVSKDTDFHQKSFLYGPPPKVIWIKKGNCSTKEIINLLQKSSGVIKSFVDDSQSAFLVL